MKSPIFRIATSPRIKEPSLLVADSVELFAHSSKVQTTGAGRKIDHTNPPVEINAVFDVRRQECHFSYAYQRKSIHSTSQLCRIQTGKDFPIFRDDEFYSTVRFLILSVMVESGGTRSPRINPELGSGRSISYEAQFKHAMIQMETGRKIADSPVLREKQVISPGNVPDSEWTLPGI